MKIVTFIYIGSDKNLKILKGYKEAVNRGRAESRRYQRRAYDGKAAKGAADKRQTTGRQNITQKAND